MKDSRTIAYLCPKCGQSVIVSKNLFELSAQTCQLPCACGKTGIEVQFLPDQVQMKVPCHVCKETHVVSCPSTSFVGEKLLSFSCSGVNCCFVGEEQAVFSATPRMEQEADLWQSQQGQMGAFLNSHVMEEVLMEIREIAGRDGISCVCGSHNWGFQVDFTTVEISCAKCGKATRIPATIAEDIDNICYCQNLVIGGNKGEEP